MVHLVVDKGTGNAVVAAVSGQKKAETFRSGYAAEQYYKLPEAQRHEMVVIESHKVIGEGFGK